MKQTVKTTLVSSLVTEELSMRFEVVAWRVGSVESELRAGGHLDSKKAPEETRNTFGSRVRSQRLLKGLTQDELAKLVGACRQSIVNIERGHCSPRPGLKTQLDSVLGLDRQPLAPSSTSTPDFVPADGMTDTKAQREIAHAKAGCHLASLSSAEKFTIGHLLRTGAVPDSSPARLQDVVDALQKSALCADVGSVLAGLIERGLVVRRTMGAAGDLSVALSVYGAECADWLKRLSDQEESLIDYLWFTGRIDFGRGKCW